MFDDYYEKWQIQKFKRKTEKNLLNLWLQEKKNNKCAMYTCYSYFIENMKI